MLTSGAVAWGTSDAPVKPSPEQKKNLPYTVALTGGIASGKTLVSDEFARLGVSIIDMDVIAHEVVEPGQPALREIEDAFGSGIIDANNQLKRSELRALIFSDLESRRILETILHPRIRQKASEAIAKVVSAYCILVIPLLADKCTYPNINRILVVDVEPETQIERLIERDNTSREQAEQALSTQITRDQRLKIADDVLVNSGSEVQTHSEVVLLHKKFTRLAAQRSFDVRKRL